jgi:histidine phosphotransferase ChpT
MSVDLNALIGSRICHDLISPLGAIGNGVELLAMSGAGEGPEIALISDSVTAANSKIRYFRVAFGASSPGQRIGAGEIKSILGGYWKTTRVQMDWQVQGDVSRQDAKLAFLLLQCLETAMPWGGRVTVTTTGEDWKITGAAERLSLDDELWAHLADPRRETALTSANVHFALAPLAAEQMKRTIEVETGPNLITLTF